MRRIDPALAPCLTCPACGRLLEIVEGSANLRFHCPTGHFFFIKDLLQAQAQGARRSLEQVARLWEGRASVLRSLAERARRDHHPSVAASYLREIGRLEERVELLRDHLLPGATPRQEGFRARA